MKLTIRHRYILRLLRIEDTITGPYDRYVPELIEAGLVEEKDDKTLHLTETGTKASYKAEYSLDYELTQTLTEQLEKILGPHEPIDIDSEYKRVVLKLTQEQIRTLVYHLSDDDEDDYEETTSALSFEDMQI